MLIYVVTQARAQAKRTAAELAHQARVDQQNDPAAASAGETYGATSMLLDSSFFVQSRRIRLRRSRKAFICC